MTKTFRLFALLVSAVVTAMAQVSQVPEYHGWEHFFRIIATHPETVRWNSNDKTAAQLGPFYLKSNFMKCSEDPDNRALSSEEIQALVNVADQLVSALDGPALLGPQGTEQKHGALVTNATENLSPDVFRLVRRHILKQILPNVERSGASPTASPTAITPMVSYMSDGVTTYRSRTFLASNSGNGSGTFVATATTAGGLSIHRYRVDVKITNPHGHVVQTNGSSYAPSAYTQASMVFSQNDVAGNWITDSQTLGFCSISALYFTAASFGMTIIDYVRLPVTFFKSPIKLVAGCSYLELDCTPGTVPSCKNGIALNITQFFTCSDHAGVVWLMINGSLCSWAGMAFDSKGPGPCS